MAINFPDSPSVNDIHTSGDMSWKWDGTTWKATITTSQPIPSQTGQAGEYLQTDGTAMSWEAVDALPSQTGQAGEFLQTDGTNATWEAVDALPSQTGQAGEFLQTDGTNATWEPVVTNPYDVATTSTGYFDIPAGTTAQRPGTPATGNMRWNTTDEALEHYGGSTAGWVQWAGAAPTITGIAPTTSIAAGTSITVQGINFQAGSLVKLIGVDATVYNAASTTFISTTEVSFTTPELPVANEPYDVKLVLPAGGFHILSDALDAGGVPAWTTAAGSLGSISDDATGTHFTLAATDPDGQAVTFAETTSVLTTANLTLNANGTITGNPTNVSTGSSTTYAFDVDATDVTGVNTTSRSFNITVGDGWYGATGGTITTDGAYTLHTFTSNGVFNPGPYPGTGEIFVIGGGGGTGNAPQPVVGNDYGDGGGGGGLSYKSAHQFTSDLDYAVTIGIGGIHGASGGADGGDSSFLASPSINMVAGGGAGAWTTGTGGAGGTATGGDTNGTGGSGGAGAGAGGPGVAGSNGTAGAAGGGGGGHNGGNDVLAGNGGNGDANYFTGGGGGGGNDRDGINASGIAFGGTGYGAGGNGGGQGHPAGQNGGGSFGGPAPGSAGSRNNTGGGGGTFGGGAGGTGGQDGGAIDGSHGAQGAVIIKYLTAT